MESYIDNYLTGIDEGLWEQALFEFMDELTELTEPHNITYELKKIGNQWWRLEMLWQPHEFTKGFVSKAGKDPLEILYYTVNWFKKNKFDGDNFMNIYKDKELFPDVEGVMIGDSPVEMTIKRVIKDVRGLPGGSRGQLRLEFQETDKGAWLNKTSMRKLAGRWGGETNEWVGKPVKLWAKLQNIAGNETWVLYVDPLRKKPTPKGAPEPAPEPAAK